MTGNILLREFFNFKSLPSLDLILDSFLNFRGYLVVIALSYVTEFNINIDSPVNDCVSAPRESWSCVLRESEHV